jgi:hypothetical protein
MREFQLNFTLSMPRRAESHCTAIDFEPPRAVVVVTQMTRPTSRFAEIGERRILLLI